MMALTVVIPTFRRPDGLERAAESILKQTGLSDFGLLIVDNDPAGSAEKTTQRLAAGAPPHIRVRYVHEPKAGVANARNAAIEHVETDLVAFLDDDQSAPETWLAELLSFHSDYPMPVTFGPVITVLPQDVRHHRAYLEDFFARQRNAPTGLIDDYYGCGNALLNLSRIPNKRPLFDTGTNETGGEDDLLFQSLLNAGHQFGWCTQAPVFEHVPEERARLGYTLRRAFAYGQGPVTLARKAVPRKYAHMAMWMLIGTGKAILNIGLFALNWIARRPRRAVYLDRAMRGLGKVAWWINLKFYGAATLAEPAQATSPDLDAKTSLKAGG